jgi:hypothetical protein
VSRRTPLVDRELIPSALSVSATRDPFGPHSPTRHAFELLAARCRDLGARLVVFGVPCVTEPDAPALVDGGAEFLCELNRDLARLGRETGFTVVSVDRAFHDAHAAGRVLIIPGDGHWNAEGHRLAAAALAPQLAALLPGAK